VGTPAAGIGDDRLRFMLYAVPLSLVIPATLGVVPESPFGAIPFWWCLGVATVMTVPIAVEKVQAVPGRGRRPGARSARV
jgi:hypothetical protein